MLSQVNTFTQLDLPHVASGVSQKRKTVMVLEESLLSRDWEKSLDDGGFKDIAKEVGVSSDPNVEEKFDYKPLTTPFAGLVQWVKIVSDKQDMKDCQYTDLQGFLESPAVVIVQNEDFCNRVILSQDGVEFESVTEYVNKITTRLKPFYPKDKSMKLIFALVDIDKHIVGVQKKVLIYSFFNIIGLSRVLRS